MSFLVVLYSDTSARLSVSTLNGSSRDFKDSSAVAPHFPSCVPILISSCELQEGEPMYLLTSEVFEIPCVCHIRIGLIDLLALPLPRRINYRICPPYRKRLYYFLPYDIAVTHLLLMPESCQCQIRIHPSV